MAQWLVNRGDGQFSVGGLSELKALASKGNLHAGDLIQPEGASDWLYAIEIPDLKGMVKTDSDDDDIEFGRKSGALNGLLYGVFGLMLLAGVGGMAYFYTQLPTGEEALLGEGGAISYTELLTTAPVTLFTEPDGNSGSVASLPKDAILSLMAKRGDFYKVSTKDNKTGWIAVKDTFAAYQTDKKMMKKLDPLYNPDQYAKVSNASWLMTEGDPQAVFSIALQNTSDYDMQDVRLEASIKDSKGAQVKQVEFPIEGMIKAQDSTMVGALNAPEEELKAAEKAGEEPPAPRLMTTKGFQDMVAELPEEEQDAMYERWLDGIVIEVEEDFVEATVRIVELRANPKEGQ
ncbi:MAG: hypothetical protein AB8H79_13090 [Myxococcota bacterium]